MKNFCTGVVVGAIFVWIGMSFATPFPKDPVRVYVPFKECECPKDFTVAECAWWEECQESRKSEWLELQRQINRGNTRAAEAVRNVSDSVGRIP